jgi:hypothetical protein
VTLSKSKEKERERERERKCNFKIGKERRKIAIWGKISWQAKKKRVGG